jgi:hypothetical protein
MDRSLGIDLSRAIAASMCDHRSGTGTLGGLSLKLKQAEHFEDDDDNDDDSDDVEDVSIHGSWITRRYPRRQAIQFLQQLDTRRLPYLKSMTPSL